MHLPRGEDSLQPRDKQQTDKAIVIRRGVWLDFYDDNDPTT